MRDFNYTVGVLVKAYLNDTLEHGDFCGCAVGNIVADSLKCSVDVDELFGSRWIRDGYTTIPHLWNRVFYTSECDDYREQIVFAYNYKGSTKRQIDSTGYAWQELARVEFAFESAPKGNSDDDWMFNGLMAVVDVLAEIHGVSLEQKEEAKALFVKP